MDDLIISVGSDGMEVLSNILDRYTGIPLTFKQVTKWADGTTMTDGDVDGIIYIKRDTKYYADSYFLSTRKIPISRLGLIGDGTTDESSTFQDALDLCGTLQASELEIPSGKFKASFEITGLNYVTDSFKVTGAGQARTVLISKDTATDVITINSPNVELSDMSITYGLNGVTVGQPSSFSVLNVKLSRLTIQHNAEAGIYPIYLAFLILDQVRSEYNKRGIYNVTGIGSNLTMLSVENSSFRQNTEYGAYIRIGKLMSFFNTSFEVNDIGGVIFVGGDTDTTSSIIMDTCWCEKNGLSSSTGVAQVILDGTASPLQFSRNIEFRNCQIGFGSEIPAVLSRRSQDVYFNNCNIATIAIVNYVVGSPAYAKFSAVRDVADSNKVYISLITANSQPFTNTAAWELLATGYTDYQITSIKYGIVTNATNTHNLRIVNYMRPMPNDYLISMAGLYLEYEYSGRLYNNYINHNLVSDKYSFPASNSNIIASVDTPEAVITALPGTVAINNSSTLPYSQIPLWYKDFGSGNTGWKSIISGQTILGIIAGTTTRVPENRDEVYRVSVPTADYNITIPLANSVIAGKVIEFVRITGNNGFKATIIAQGSDTISNPPLILTSLFDRIKIISNGISVWDVITNQTKIDLYTLKSFTVATLPTASAGTIAYVTDATAPAYLAIVAGGGSVVTPVFYNGTNWVCH